MNGLTVEDINRMAPGTKIYDNHGDRWQVLQVFGALDKFLQFMKGADPDIETIESAVQNYSPFSEFEGAV